MDIGRIKCLLAHDGSLHAPINRGHIGARSVRRMHGILHAEIQRQVPANHRDGLHPNNVYSPERLDHGPDIIGTCVCIYYKTTELAHFKSPPIQLEALTP